MTTRTSHGPDDAAPVVVWFRADLRLDDNPALAAAADTGRPVIAVHVLETEPDTLRPLGAASRWWLHQSLAALSGDLGHHGVPLVLRRGDAGRQLAGLVEQTGADCVFWNRRTEAAARAVDAAVRESLGERGVTCREHNGHLLAEPGDLCTKSGGPYRVYTPFRKALAARGAPRPPLDAPGAIAAYRGPVAGEDLADLALLPEVDWAGGIAETWQPGEAGARARLGDFLDHGLARYHTGRNLPGEDGTSALSPHLRFGEISPNRVWHAVRDAEARSGLASGPVETYLGEIVWREFCHHLLHHFPDLATDNYAAKFDAFPWRDDDDAFRAWTRGRTGYPVVDAGMRQLWRTGWMHNRVRMIAASFLCKHLLIDWRRGEQWFWDTLVDADPANNPANWQWVAGSGADAAPYFRVFNPVLQGTKFDPEGLYVRRYVPELEDLDAKWIHRPWEAPKTARAAADHQSGATYPRPLVDHAAARDRALDAFRSLGDPA